MRLEKVYKRDNGLKVKITTNLSIDFMRDGFRYSSHVEVCEKTKRKYRSPMTKDECATSEEINNAQNALWLELKPSQAGL